MRADAETLRILTMGACVVNIDNRELVGVEWGNMGTPELSAQLCCAPKTALQNAAKNRNKSHGHMSKRT